MNNSKLNANKKSEYVINLFSKDHSLTVFLKYLKRQPWRTFYSIFIPKTIRVLQKKKANILQKKHVQHMWKIFIDKYMNNDLSNFNLQPKHQFFNEKIIWQYWGQGIASATQNPTVQLCFASVDKFKNDFQVIRLDDENLKYYLDLPEFIWERKQNPYFKPAFFADLIRLALLDTYGGVWIDATILLTAPIDPLLLKQDFFMFQRHFNAINKKFWEDFNQDYFGWDDEHNVNVLNSFIVAKKNNKIIHACFEIMMNYWRTQNKIPHYFIFQIMFNELLKRHEIVDSNNLIIDDTSPHLLQAIIHTPFNEAKYSEIIQKTNIHKINYSKEIVSGSYYEYLVNIILDNS